MFGNRFTSKWLTHKSCAFACYAQSISRAQLQTGHGPRAIIHHYLWHVMIDHISHKRIMRQETREDRARTGAVIVILPQSPPFPRTPRSARAQHVVAFTSAAPDETQRESQSSGIRAFIWVSCAWERAQRAEERGGKRMQRLITDMSESCCSLLQSLIYVAGS